MLYCNLFFNILCTIRQQYSNRYSISNNRIRSNSVPNKTLPVSPTKCAIFYRKFHVETYAIQKFESVGIETRQFARFDSIRFDWIPFGTRRTTRTPRPRVYAISLAVQGSPRWPTCVPGPTPRQQLVQQAQLRGPHASHRRLWPGPGPEQAPRPGLPNNSKSMADKDASRLASAPNKVGTERARKQ